MTARPGTAGDDLGPRLVAGDRQQGRGVQDESVYSCRSPSPRRSAISSSASDSPAGTLARTDRLEPADGRRHPGDDHRPVLRTWRTSPAPAGQPEGLADFRRDDHPAVVLNCRVVHFQHHTLTSVVIVLSLVRACHGSGGTVKPFVTRAGAPRSGPPPVLGTTARATGHAVAVGFRRGVSGGEHRDGTRRRRGRRPDEGGVGQCGSWNSTAGDDHGVGRPGGGVSARPTRPPRRRGAGAGRRAGSARRPPAVARWRPRTDDGRPPGTAARCPSDGSKLTRSSRAVRESHPGAVPRAAGRA